jgi:hypothetical protein
MMERPARLVTALVTSLTLSGCIDIQVRAGTRPDIAALEQRLIVGQSSVDDVIAVLGKPNGKGMSSLPFEQASRPMWSYYYEEGSLKDDRRTFLFVSINKDRYDGYLWFSSLPQPDK